jgi:hypothetical protein
MTNGDVAVDPRQLDVSALLVNALGIPATQINKIKWTRGQQYELTQYFSKESGRIRNEYLDARSSGDGKAANNAITEFRDLQKQKDRVRPFFGNDYKALKRQSVSDLMRSPLSRMRREQKAQRRFE